MVREGDRMSADYQILTTSGADLWTLFAEVEPGQTKVLQTLRIFNLGSTSAANLRLKAKNKGVDGAPLAAGWLEIKVGEAWISLTPSTPVALTPPAGGSFIDIEARLAAPVDAASGTSLQAQIRAEWW